MSRPMTREEREGKAICIACWFSISKKNASGTPEKLWFCKKKFPEKYDYVHGQVEGDFSPEALCSRHNKDGECELYIAALPKPSTSTAPR